MKLPASLPWKGHLYIFLNVISRREMVSCDQEALLVEAMIGALIIRKGILRVGVMA